MEDDSLSGCVDAAGCCSWRSQLQGGDRRQCQSADVECLAVTEPVDEQ